MSTRPPPHSAEQFGEQRDFWWHRDFLDLMAARWRLREAASLADIGCGLCHWSRLLYPYLRRPTRFAGIDREARWIAEAPLRFRQAFPDVSPETFSFHQGDATHLPLPDDTFDVATCQTVLMHLPDPMAALREMRRILRPGGLLVCVEPNNLWNYFPFTSLTATEPVESITQRFEFWLRCHRGRVATGRGNDCIGELLPGYFAELGLGEIAVYQSDRAGARFPPYNTPEQKALLQQERQWQESATGPWDRADVRELVLSGGGTQEFFERGFAMQVDQFHREQQAIAAGAFHAAGGAITYLVSGRKA